MKVSDKNKGNKKNIKSLDMKSNGSKKLPVIRIKRKSLSKKNSGYDIEALTSGNDRKNSKIKKASFYLISKSTSSERRKKLGL